MKYISLICILLLVNLQSIGQKLNSFISHDTMMYIFKLDKEQTNYIVKKNQIQDTNFLFTHLYKTYPRSNYVDNILPNGNFIIASITGEIINYRYVYISSFQIKSKVIDNDVILFISDKKTKSNIEKARIEIDGKLIPFNKGYGGYAFNNSTIDKEKLQKNKIYASISIGDEYAIMQYGFNKGYIPPPPNSYRVAGGESEGYLISDKPIYKPGDTLRIKAFLMNSKNGKPIRKRSRLTINEPLQNFNFSKKIKPITPGAFVFNWPIPDSLKIDRTVNLRFDYKKGGGLFTKTSSFYLENYTLNNNNYDLQLHDELFYAGEDIRFLVSATDANQFPLQGTLVHYKISLLQVNEFLSDSLTLSESKRMNWFEKDTIYPNQNYMELSIPSNILPNANAQYNLEVSFTDPNSYERKVFTKPFSKLMQKEKVLIYQQDDSAHIHCLYNLRDTNRQYQLISMSNSDTLFKKTITTPYSFKLSPYNTQVIFIDKDSMNTALNITFNKLNITNIKGKRDADSIHISFSFPFEEPIYYRILKNKQLVEEGNKKKLDFSMKDESKDSYTILFTSNINGNIENNYYKICYVPQQHKIKLSSTIPKQAYPGQKVSIKIQATDYKNKALSKVNLATYAVNKQFADKLLTPQILVPQNFQDLVEIKPVESTDNISLISPNLNWNYTITNHHLKKYNLQRNEYYELRYPKNEMAFLRSDIQSPIPEFAVTVTNKNRLYSPKYILLDDEPVYISDLNKNTYSFQAKAGKHQIAIRYFNKKIIFNDIQLEAFKKYWIGINIDSMYKSTKKIKIIDSLPVAQPNPEEKNLLYNSLLLTKPFAYDSLLIKNNNSSNQITKYSRSNTPQILNIDGDAFYVFGPLQENTNARLSVNSKEHSLKISSNYAHYYDEFSKEFTTKHIGDIKGIIFGFSENNLQDYQLSALYKPDTIKPAIESVEMKYDHSVNKAIYEENKVEYQQNYKSSNNTNTFFSIKINNADRKKYVKALWIINQTQSNESDFTNIIPRINSYPYYKYGALGRYDLYILMSDERLVHLKNIDFHNHDEFYINPVLFASAKINNDELAVPLKIYNELTKVPLVSFYFPPEEANENFKQTRNTKSIYPYLHGIITDKSLSALSDVLVFAEVNGQFKYGARTNQNGEFEIIDMLPGTYQIKIYHPAYQFKHFSSKYFESGSSYEINTSLHESETQKPLYETIHNDFRFLIFKDAKQKGLCKIRLYDKESRSIVQDATLKLFINEELIKEYQSKNNYSIEFALPKNKDTIYRIEINRKGFLPLVFHNIKFEDELFYLFQVFLTPLNDKQLFLKKEYNIEMSAASIAYLKEQTVYRSIEESSPNRDYESASKSTTSYNVQLAPTIQATGAYTNSYAASAPMSDVIISNIEGISSYSIAYNRQRKAMPAMYNSIESIPASEQMINEIANNPSLNTIRKNFTDVGFWEPNHITDKNGSASFEIQLPDNITTWKSMILAVGKNRLHGMDSIETKVFKPMQTMSIIPLFLWDNDKVYAKVKYTNLTKDAKETSIHIKVNGHTMLTKNITLKNEYTDSILLHPGADKSLRWQAGLQFEKSYNDIEEREIPVFSSAFSFYSNRNILMNKDSVYQLKFANNTKGTIILNNTLYEKIITEIDDLSKYEYGCVEQTTSKLKALLCKNKINRALDLKQNLTPTIYSLINRLTNYQHKDGSWGWWKEDPSNWRMTIYALEVLQNADALGFSNSAYTLAKEAIRANLHYFNISDKLYAIYVMQRLNATSEDMFKEMEQINLTSLRTIDKVYYYKIKENRGEKINPNELYALSLEMNHDIQLRYNDNFFYDPSSGVYTAYFLFKNSSLSNEWLQVFKQKILNGQLEQNLNTYAKANMIEALTGNWENTNNKPITAQVILNDTLKIKTFPYTLPIKESSYRILHNGGDVFLNTAEERSIFQPAVSDSIFKISSAFIQQGKTSEELIAGIPCQLKVSIDAYRSKDYVMVEIPIPSGMRFENKNQQTGCTIEYRKNKIVVFYNHLTMNQHQLIFDIIPNLKGQFVLPAAKCSLMYYPYIYGNNSTKEITIK